MNYEEAIQFTETRLWKGGYTGFDRLRSVLAELGDPQKRLRFIHVAGSNGKGSTCAMIDSILREAGYKSGLFTSPHLIKYNERVIVNGEAISDEDYAEGCTLVKEAMEAAGVELTIFERLTALGFWYFDLKGCDAVVLEVGLGGRRDSTNVIEMPEAALIAHLALEHTSYLGHTIEEIAVEKAGIIKPGCDAVVMDQDPSAIDVIRTLADARKARMRLTDPSKERLVSSELGLQVIDYRDRKDLKLGLFGSYQFSNAALVLDALDLLIEKGWNISEDAIRRGLEHASWPGRFQLLQRDPIILLDGAHNPDGAEVLADSLRRYLPGMKFDFMMGVMADKDYKEMLDTVAPLADSFICVSPDENRGLRADELRELISASYGVPADSCASVEEGLELALSRQKKGRALVIFGSLYQAGDVLKYFKEHGLIE
ncbi:MAG: bifunctional folylpolyglutamate synthase/dihydrofolate synthase [Firmicutes bacterium]|nr:bifunctional folylpolyglutamate synthase/dihydrofolate synthase [Bacillota bacterium]